MKIEELDEWQGLTREMVDHYLNRSGWCNMPDPDQRLLKPQYAHVSFKMGLGAAIERIASIVGSTPQAILREINPRMRKGWPSGAAIAAHEASGGNWLSQSAQNGGVLRVLNWSVSDHRAKLNTLDTTQKIPRDMVPDSWCFWPCDKHGNKVRWPTDAEGKML